MIPTGVMLQIHILVQRNRQSKVLHKPVTSIPDALLDQIESVVHDAGGEGVGVGRVEGGRLARHLPHVVFLHHYVVANDDLHLLAEVTAAHQVLYGRVGGWLHLAYRLRVRLDNAVSGAMDSGNKYKVTGIE